MYCDDPVQKAKVEFPEDLVGRAAGAGGLNFDMHSGYVNVTDAPDYYNVIRTPVDLSMVKRRLHRTPKYYLTPDQLYSDLYLMCENCRVYNDPATSYWECATRLEAFVRAHAAEATVVRRADAGGGASEKAEMPVPSG